MMYVGSGNRDEWEFEYAASKVAEGARAQKAFRESRVEFWQSAYERCMAEIKDRGLEVVESEAQMAGQSYAIANTRGIITPQIKVHTELQQRLTEAHQKVAEHRQMVAVYDGWVQVLEANAEARLKLAHADWLFFFGKA